MLFFNFNFANDSFEEKKIRFKRLNLGKRKNKMSGPDILFPFLNESRKPLTAFFFNGRENKRIERGNRREKKKWVFLYTEGK